MRRADQDPGPARGLLADEPPAEQPPQAGGQLRRRIAHFFTGGDYGFAGAGTGRRRSRQRADRPGDHQQGGEQRGGGLQPHQDLGPRLVSGIVSVGLKALELVVDRYR